ncbi:hypothetical protein PRCB_09200 [Pantoea rodasii]|uniref:Uncharacterized protein n=1 Tax=Pantoea rodasii TaxID=1076549 RepID=A0A2M9WE65_9GAMM|nr:LysO family transporter [Pantoea rodasii]PJZ05835.1 hypothetical protein PRCB_09200 [Pantoea rodasii]
MTFPRTYVKSFHSPYPQSHLDSALPFTKENCEETFISHAIFSGFILTVLAPFFYLLLSNVT